jgi:hypothetical protein
MEIKELVNLTSHTIKLIDGSEIQPSGIICRAEFEEEIVGMVHNTPIIRYNYKNIYGLPLPQEGVIYLVSSIVLNAVNELYPTRKDCVSVGKLIRDHHGKVIAAQVLRQNG